MTARQTRIFAPPKSPFDGVNWAETVIGLVILPIVKGQPKLDWYWFSKYVAPRGKDDDDCNIHDVPSDYEDQEVLKSIRFRYAVAGNDMTELEDRIRDRVNRGGSLITDCRDYDYVSDLGGERFCGSSRSSLIKSERADIVVECLHAVSKLVIHSLEGPDKQDRFKIEGNSSNQNPNGSLFESIHHLFCNISAVPLKLQVYEQGGQRFIATPWMEPAQGWALEKEIDIRF